MHSLIYIERSETSNQVQSNHSPPSNIQSNGFVNFEQQQSQLQFQLMAANSARSSSSSSISESLKDIKNDKSIIILEPNLTYQKNCLIPIFIAEEFERINPGEIDSCNIIGGKTIENNDYLISLIMSLDIYKKRKNYIKFYDRMPFLNAVFNYGSIVISHQIQNDLNYLYFDALYLNIPLIHNSERLSKFGFYYKNHNISEGAMLLKDCLENYKNNLNNQKLNSQELFFKHSIDNIQNTKTYLEIIRSVIN